MTKVVLALTLVGDGQPLAQAPVLFEAGTSSLFNPLEAQFEAVADGTIAAVELRRPHDAAPFFTVGMATPQQVRVGDAVSFGPGQLSLRFEHHDGQILQLNSILAPTPHGSLAAMLAAAPEATPQQIWDVAFMAGVNITTTLLGGTRE